MDYVILDLEWNGSYSKRYHKYVNEIIEFGAVKIDSNLQVVDQFSMLIKPQIGKKITNIVENLTHITNEELTESDNTFTHVLSKFVRFLGNSILLSWGTGDVLTLIENHKYFFQKDTLPFLKQYCNLQLYCQKRMNLNEPSKQLGLSNCAQLLGIAQDGLDLHRAYDDALLSSACFIKLFDKPSLLTETEDASSPEFYRKLFFKPTYIYDINNPLIDKKQMYFRCDKCNARAKQKTKWKVKNRCFAADFKCPDCKREFIGRISYKLRYDGVTMRKKIYDKVKKSPRVETASGAIKNTILP